MNELGRGGTLTYRHRLDDLKVRDLQLWVPGCVEVFLGHHDALFEEVFVDSDAVLLGHQHPATEREMVLPYNLSSPPLTKATTLILFFSGRGVNQDLKITSTLPIR